MDRRIIIISIVLAGLLCAATADARMGITAVCGGFGQSASEWLVEDDFSVDDSSPLINYTRISGSGTMIISSGVARTTTFNLPAVYQHNTDLGSADMVVRAKICDGSNLNSSGIVLRSNGTTAHSCRSNAAANRFDCEPIGGSGSYIYKGWAALSWVEGTCHVVEISAIGSTYTFSVDFNNDGDFGDANEAVGPATNSDFSGTRAGVSFYYSTIADDIYIDDFKAKANE